MHPLRHWSFLLGLAFITGCGSSEKFADRKDLTGEEKKEIELKELASVLDFEPGKDSVKVDVYWLTTAPELTQFYNTTGKELFWFTNGQLKPHTRSFLQFLSASKYYGLDSNLYYYNEIKKGIDTLAKTTNFYAQAQCEALNDVLLTNAWLLAAVHLNKGFLHPEELKIVWKKDSLETNNLVKTLRESADTFLLTKLKAYEPQNIEYRYLKAGLKNFLDHHTLDTVAFKVPDPKKDSAACWAEISKALLHWKYIDSLNVSYDTLVDRVKKFQADNGLDADAIIGAWSRKGFATSNAKRFYYAALSLEKWRWKPVRDGKLQIRVNIPSYELNAIRNDSIIRRHRVVTGAPDTRSPQLQAKIRYITIFPYWHVPHSIASKEIAVFARRDSSYLRKHGYTLYNLDRTEADLSTVKWKSLSENYFPYRVRQNGGYGNSLGIISFHFPNKYDVYLHDTPSKRFFNKTVRAFSHGCIRLQNPVAFAQFLLEQEMTRKEKKDFNRDTLQSWIDRHYEQRVPLKKSVPIELDYITVTADSLGNILFHPDVYEKETEMVEIMNPCTKYRPKKKAPVKKEEEVKVTAMLLSRRHSFMA